MEIAKGIKAKDYMNLNLSQYSNSDWQKAIDYFEKRITGRFIEPVELLLTSEHEKPYPERKYGFTILAIDFLLIETIQSFIDGVTNTKHKSKKLFVKFLKERDNFKPFFESKYNPKEFYINFRCGILHQSQTFESTKIWSVGDMISKYGKVIIVNREAFHKNLIEEFNRYLKNLRTQNNCTLLNNFRKKMDFIAGKE